MTLLWFPTLMLVAVVGVRVLGVRLGWWRAVLAAWLGLASAGLFLRALTGQARPPLLLVIGLGLLAMLASVGIFELLSRSLPTPARQSLANPLMALRGWLARGRVHRADRRPAPACRQPPAGHRHRSAPPSGRHRLRRRRAAGPAVRARRRPAPPPRATLNRPGLSSRRLGAEGTSSRRERWVPLCRATCRSGARFGGLVERSARQSRTGAAKDHHPPPCGCCHRAVVVTARQPATLAHRRPPGCVGTPSRHHIRRTS